ncbi:PACE efflux transporter [Acetobacter sp.]|uniref:PACE efflux transporter n=1 Tax=Acetobacter sp. TaxID=440 RepID=UPI0039EC9A76
MSTATQSSPPPMRSPGDRVRHALMFEGVALAIVIPFGSVLFNLQAESMSVIGIGSAIAAMVWNYVYNLFFDRFMVRMTGSTAKTVGVRVFHTLLFEAGLQIVLLPAIGWYLGISILQAFSLSMAIAVFYLFYAFLFNMAYDAIFPVRRRRSVAEEAIAAQ